MTKAIVPTIESKVLLIPGKRVMLSPDLAALYGVEPRALVQAVKRNGARFPEDFMFQLSADGIGTPSGLFPQVS